VLGARPASAQYTYTTIAGTPSIGTVDGVGSAARFNVPQGSAVDAGGNVYIASVGDHTIRKMTPAGSVTAFVGLANTPGSADGTGSAARFLSPSDVAIDAAGNLYVADSGNRTVRKITPAGVVTTLAGSPGLSGSNDGTGSAARFNTPFGIALDSSANVYVSDSGFNNNIRKITPAGVVTTLAGNPTGPGSNDGTGTGARFSSPRELAVDGAGNVFVADFNNHTIRKITPAGIVTTLAGLAGTAGEIDGVGNAARFQNPTGLAIDPAGNLYVGDASGRTVRTVTPGGAVTTLAGLAFAVQNIDGTGNAARFVSPNAVAFDGISGSLYVMDPSVNVVRKVTLGGVVTTVAGFNNVGTADGAGSNARFVSASGAAVSGAGTLYVADLFSQTIRGITPAGVVTTFAGLAGIAGSVDGTGSAARFRGPAGTAVDAAGNVYVADSNNHAIRKITPAGVVTTLAGSLGLSGSDDGTGSAARFNSPFGVAVDSTANVYVADTGNNAIRKITPAGVVTTLAGLAGSSGGSADGTGSAARFLVPRGLVVDGAGNVFVTDTNNNTIRKITSAGVVTTVAGFVGSPGSSNGFGSAARFNTPWGIAIDAGGTLYVVDQSTHIIRSITPSGNVGTVGGTPNFRGATDGVGSSATFNLPRGIAVDGAGNLLIADFGNNIIRKGTLSAATAPTIFQQPSNSTVSVGYGRIFTIAASGSPVVSFQWQVSTNGGASFTNVTDSELYAGSQGPTLSLTGIPLSLNNAQFRCVVTNGVLPNATSNAATLTVLQPPTFTTLAGVLRESFADGTGPGARFNFPWAVTIDSSSNLYVADTNNQIIRKVTPAGVVSTFAGVPGLSGNFDGPGNAARFAGPQGVAVDLAGNVYVADTRNFTIRKITPAGVVSTLAGFSGLSGGNDGTGSFAQFAAPQGIAVDNAGNVYVADTTAIRKITPAGVVTTLAGLAFNPGTADGAGSIARFNNATGIAVDPGGFLYVADSTSHTIRKITPAGVVTTLAGTAGSPGAVDATGAAARFNNPIGVTVDIVGNVFVADGANNRVRMITPAGVVTTIAGAVGCCYIDGPVASARFNFPRGVAVDGTTLYVVESGNGTIRKIAAGIVSTFAGVAQSTYLDGTGSAARFGSSNAINVGIALDPAGNIYVADLGNRNIRMITPAGVVTTLANSSNFISPIGIAFDPVNNVLRVVENIGVEISPGQTPGRIRTVTLGGVVTTLVSPPAVLAPQAIAIDETGLMYVYDAGVIWKITPAGAMTVLAGAQNTSGNVDATGAAARFGNVYGLAVDSAHNVYVADAGTSTIRKVTPAGVVTTLAGLGFNTGLNDGTGTAARFAALSPRGIAVDAAGVLYVTDTGNNAVRSVTPGGFVRTLAGLNTSSNAQDGLGVGARFVQPTGIAIDAAGKLYVMDGGTGLRLGQVVAPPGGCTYTLGATSASFDASGGFGTIAVTAAPGCPWSAVNNNAPFVSIIGGSSGIGNGTVAYTVPQNTSGVNLWSNNRSGMLSIEGQVFSVTQGGCSYTTTPPSVTFPAAGGPASIAVNTAFACSWAPFALPDWVSNLTVGPFVVAGPGALNLEAGPNTSGSPRSFNVPVAGLVVPLQQATVPVRPMTPGSRLTFSLANASAAQWLSAEIVGGRSYCIQVTASPTATTPGNPILSFFNNNNPTPDQITGQTPRLCGGSDQNEHVSFRITQSDSSSRSYRLHVVETTLFTNWFFTGGDYSSFTLLRNTTDQTINGGVTWYSDAGVFAGGQDFQIAPGAIVFFDARTNANVTAGSVQIQHDGPPQGLVGSQTTLSATTGLSFDTIFVDRIKEKGRY